MMESEKLKLLTLIGKEPYNLSGNLLWILQVLVKNLALLTEVQVDLSLIKSPKRVKL
jgi:hypothetical protein